MFDAALQGDRTGLENHKPSGRCRRIAILVAAPRPNGTASRFDRGVDDRNTAAGGQSIEVFPSDLLGHFQPGPALVAIFHALAGIEDKHGGDRSVACRPRRRIGHFGSHAGAVPPPGPQCQQQRGDHTQSASQQCPASREHMTGPFAATPAMGHHAVDDQRQQEHCQQPQPFTRPLRPVIRRRQLRPGHRQHQQGDQENSQQQQPDVSKPQPATVVASPRLEQAQGREQVRLGTGPQQHVQDDRHRGQSESIDDGGVDQLHRVTTPIDGSEDILTARTRLRMAEPRIELIRCPRSAPAPHP